MDSIFIKYFLGQDLQDYQDYFFVLPHFPEGNIESIPKFILLPYTLNLVP